jgi:hypothetical protein
LKPKQLFRDAALLPRELMTGGAIVLLELFAAIAQGPAKPTLSTFHAPPTRLDPIIFWAAFGAVATFLGSVAAALAANSSFRAIRESHMATQASLLSGLLSEYSLPKMKNALRLLGTHKATYQGGFVAAQQRHLEMHWPSGARVDEARRYLSHYFFRVYRLRKGHYIDEKFFDQVAELDGVGILLNVCEGLAADLHPEYNKDFFAAYRACWGDRKDEHRIRPLPPSSPVASRIVAGLRLVRRLERFETCMRGLHQQIEGRLYAVSHAGVMARIEEIENLADFGRIDSTLEGIRDAELETAIRGVLSIGTLLLQIKRAIGPADLQPEPGEDPPFNLELKTSSDSLLTTANNTRAVVSMLREFVGVMDTGA